MQQLVLVLAISILAGCSASDQQRIREQVEGVRQQTQEATTNAAVEGKVKAALATRKGLEGTEISVEARDGHVVLKGNVQSTGQAELAEQVARETQGVNTVDNQLMLQVPAKPGPNTVPQAPSTPSAAPPAHL